MPVFPAGIQSFNLLLLDQAQPLEWRWSAVVNDTPNTILGGFAIGC